VIDGDTVDVRCGEYADRVRLLRIDTPERGRTGYSEAKRSLHAMVANQEVYLEFETPGQPERGGYGRLLAYLYIDGANVNVEMVRQGWSEFWTKYGAGRLAGAFEEAEAEAREGQRGLWTAQVAASGFGHEVSDLDSPVPSSPGSCIPASQCCRICRRGKACGSTCISRRYTCWKGRGCACDAASVCQ
jgi:micrococcal nuclease